MILTKLKTHSSVATLAKLQGTDTAIAKLQVPDDVLAMLNTFALGDDGKIILEKAAQVLQDQGRLGTLLKLNRELTDAENNEIAGIVRRVMKAYKE